MNYWSNAVRILIWGTNNQAQLSYFGHIMWRPDSLDKILMHGLGRNIEEDDGSKMDEVRYNGLHPLHSFQCSLGKLEGPGWGQIFMGKKSIWLLWVNTDLMSHNWLNVQSINQSKGRKQNRMFPSLSLLYWLELMSCYLLYRSTYFHQDVEKKELKYLVPHW